MIENVIMMLQFNKNNLYFISDLHNQFIYDNILKFIDKLLSFVGGERRHKNVIVAQ